MIKSFDLQQRFSIFVILKSPATTFYSRFTEQIKKLDLHDWITGSGGKTHLNI